jgi:hypothetical protein
MAAPEQKQNLIPQEPSLKDLLDAQKKQTFLGLFCHHIGSIEEFDPEKQTAKAKLVYKFTQFRPDPQGNLVPQLVEYPILADCPVIFLGGSGEEGASITVPPVVGDECLILFNDRSIDNWFAGNTGGELNSQRMHHISDGIILIGVRSLARSLVGFDMDRILVKKGQAKVGVGKDGQFILIANEAQNLKTIFGDLTTQLKELTTQLKSLTDSLASMTMTGVTPGGGVSGPPGPPFSVDAPVIGTAIENIGTQIESIMNDNIAELLE